MPLKFLKRQTCPVCGFGDSRLLYTRRFDEDPIRAYLRVWYRGRVPISRFGVNQYAVMECPDCGLLYQQNVLDDDGLSLLYGSWINPEKSQRKKNLRARREGLAVARQIHTLETLFSRRDGVVNVVELGCGWGNWLLMARAFGYHAVGVEIDSRRRASVVAEGIPCYENSDQLPQNSADFVYAQQVFEHLQQPLQVLQSLVRALRPGGYVQIAVPNANWVKRNLSRGRFIGPKGFPKSIRRSLNPIAPLEHLNAFAETSLARLGLEAGLSPCQTRSALFPPRTNHDYVRQLPRLIYGAIRGHAAVSALFRKPAETAAESPPRKASHDSSCSRR
jgi:SAM-dependent methyltransferase